MNLKKFFLVVLVFGFVAIAAHAQEMPMRGMYVTDDSRAEYKYITLEGDRDSNQREIKFMSSDGQRVLYTYRIQYYSSSSIYAGQTGHGTFELKNLSRESFTLRMAMGRNITYIRM